MVRFRWLIYQVWCFHLKDNHQIYNETIIIKNMILIIYNMIKYHIYLLLLESFVKVLWDLIQCFQILSFFKNFFNVFLKLTF